MLGIMISAFSGFGGCFCLVRVWGFFWFWFFSLETGNMCFWVCRFLFIGGGKDPVLNSFILCSGVFLRKVRHACNL